MAKYSTPGVYLKEIDKSEVLLTASVGGAATVIKSSQGPMWRPITINNNRQLSGIFGKPTLPEEDEFGRPVVPNYGYGLYSASSYLAEGQGLTMVRAADGDHVQIEDPSHPGDMADTPYLKDYSYATQTYGFHKITDVFTSESPDPSSPNANIIHEKAAQNRANSTTQILAVDETSKGQWKTENIDVPNFGFAFAGGPSGQGYNVGTSVEFFYNGCSWMYKYDDEDKINILVGMFQQLGHGHITEKDIADYIDQNELVAPLVFQVKVYVKNVTDLWGTFIKDEMSAPVEIYECNATSRNLKTEQNTSLFVTDVINGNSSYIYAKYLSKLTTLQVIKQITNREGFNVVAEGVEVNIRYNGVLEFNPVTKITKYGYKDSSSNWIMDIVDNTKIYNAEMPYKVITDDLTSVQVGGVVGTKDSRLGTAIGQAEWVPPLCSTDGFSTNGTLGKGIMPQVSDASGEQIKGFTPTELSDLATWGKYAYSIVDGQISINLNGVAAFEGPAAWYNFPSDTISTLVINGTATEWTNVDITGDNYSITYHLDDFEDGDKVSGDTKVKYWLNKVISMFEENIPFDATSGSELYYTQDDVDLANKILNTINKVEKEYNTSITSYNKSNTKITIPTGNKVKAFVISNVDNTVLEEVETVYIMEDEEQSKIDSIKSFPNTYNSNRDVIVKYKTPQEELPSYPAILRMVDVNVESNELFIAGHLDGGSEPDVDYDHLMDEGLKSGWMLISNPEKYVAPHLLVPTYQTSLKQFINSVVIPKRKRDSLQISQSGDICLNQDYDTNGDLHAEKIIAAEQFGYPNSSYIGLYCGWGLVVDTANDREVWLPNAIFASQAIARTDNVANVWDAPAGQNRGVIPAIRQKFDMSNDEIGKVYDNNINAAKEFMGIGSVLWGQKTAQRKASALDRINVRRTLLFIEKTVQLFLNPLILDVNNTPDIRLRVWNQINNFLQSVKAQNGLTDYQVICDDSNNPPEVIDANTLNVDILVKPVKTIEFIDVNVIVASTGLSFEEARVR